MKYFTCVQGRQDVGKAYISLSVFWIWWIGLLH